MNDALTRPNPDELLQRLESSEKKKKRGKLKIFFGSSAGVGKTYAMLTSAHEALKDGKDVVVGVVETHHRTETEKLLEGLELLPPITVTYRGITVCELDLNAAIARKPQILLIDELAHTNAPGSRHPKRWNDVVEILDAGIDVLTTLNVQHIESLADVVAGSTGIWVHETIPDSIFDGADEIVLVDLEADDLLKRLADGKVYLAPHVKAEAAEHFFRKNNLIALREIALRRVADRVDAQMDDFYGSQGLQGRLPIAEKILVCVDPSPFSMKLVRSAKRVSLSLKAHWDAVYVEDADHHLLSEAGKQSLDLLSRTIEQMGGRMVVLQDDSPTDVIISFAKRLNYTKIIVGRSNKPFWQTFYRRRFVEHLIAKSGTIDVYVITDDAETAPTAPVPLFKNDILAERKPSFYAASALLFAIGTLFGLLLKPFLSDTDMGIFYLLLQVYTASSFGRGPALLQTWLCAFGLNFFFMPPYFSLEIDDPSRIVHFLLMIMVGTCISTIVGHLRLRALAARERERRTQALYRLTRELTSVRGRIKTSEVVAKYIGTILGVETTIWLATTDNHPLAIVGNLPEDGYAKEMGVLQWCYDNAQVAGRNTTTMPSAQGLYFPLITSTGPIGVMGIYPLDPSHEISRDEISTAETITALLGTALERVRAGEIAEQARVKEESEKLRDELQKARDLILAAQHKDLLKETPDES